MRIDYKGFDIDVRIRESVAGFLLLYYSVFRNEDLWELTSGCSALGDSVEEWAEDMKKLVDEYLSNPQDYKYKYDF